MHPTNAGQGDASRPETKPAELHPTVVERLKDVPDKYRTLYIRAINGEASPRQAIKVKCYECMGWQGDGRSLSNEVAACTSYACPVYAYRPGAKKKQ